MKLEVRYVADRMALSYKQVSSKPIDIEVKPIPSQFKGNYWLPASKLRLQENWNPPLDKLREGEPATRTITLTADGSLSNLLPPITQNDMDFAKQYPDQPALSDDTSKDGVIAKRVEKIAIIPNRSGDFTLPAINIPWWNSKKQRMEIASLKSRQVTVRAGKVVKSATPAKPEAQARVAPSQNQQAQQSIPVAPGQLALASDKTWFYVSLVLAALWLATLAAWIMSSQRPASGRERSAAPRSNREQIEKAIEKAVNRGDLQSVKQLLIQWSQSVWGRRAPRSIGAMIRYSNKALADELDYLNKLLYAGKTPRHWDGKGLCAALKAYKVSDQEQAGEGLRPLYQGNL